MRFEILLVLKFKSLRNVATQRKNIFNSVVLKFADYLMNFVSCGSQAGEVRKRRYATIFISFAISVVNPDVVPAAP